MASRALPFSRPVRRARRSCGCVRQRRDGFGVLPGEHLRRRHQRGLGPRFGGDCHGEQGDDGLARSDIPLEKTQHPVRRGKIGRDFFERGLLRSRQREWERRSDPCAHFTIAGEPAAALGFEVPAHQRKRKLTGEEFVIGEALPGWRAVRDILGVVRSVDALDRLLEIRPIASLEPVALLPFGKIRNAFDGLSRRLERDLSRQSRSQRVDRLQQRHLIARFRRHDIVGVRHLQLLAVAFDAAGDEADFADRQLLLDKFVLGVEEDEVDAPRVVLARDLVGGLGVAARRGLVLQHPELQGHDRAWDGGRELGLAPPVDDTRRHMP